MYDALSNHIVNTEIKHLLCQEIARAHARVFDACSWRA